MNPLDQLADIQIPSEVSVWPLAWGYWVIIAVAICVIIAATVLIFKHLSWHKLKRQALIELSNIDVNQAYFEHKLQVVLKSVCAHYFSDRKEIKNKTFK